LLVLSDDAERATRSTNELPVDHVHGRFDPAADLHGAKVELVHNHASFTPPIALDARIKPWYPIELFCDDATAALSHPPLEGVLSARVGDGRLRARASRLRLADSRVTMAHKQIALDVSAFLDSREARALSTFPAEQVRKLAEIFVGLCYDHLAKAPRLIDAEDMRGAARAS